MATNNSGRKVLVGIDGVPYSLLQQLIKEGVTPNLANIAQQGNFNRADSTVPAVSSASWSSIITGKNPGSHGIYGFTQMIEGTYTLSYPNFKSLGAKPFWQNNRGKSMILNVPATYPAQEMNGMHVSGFVSPDLEQAVHPKHKLDLLKSINYKIDIDSGKAQKSPLLLFKQLFDTLEAREKLFEKTWQDDWQHYMLVFTGSDRLEHFLWNAWEEKDHEQRDKFLKYFRRVDKIIGEVFNSLDSEDSLIVLSDHGMERVNSNVNLNTYLEQEGLLTLDHDSDLKKYNRIQQGSLAFALEHGRIYLNKKDNYPQGTVEKKEEQTAMDKVERALKSMKFAGQPVIKQVKRKEDVYTGDYLHKAPDLVAIPHKGFNLRGKLGKDIFESSPMQGMHNREAFALTYNLPQTISEVSQAGQLMHDEPTS